MRRFLVMVLVLGVLTGAGSTRGPRAGAAGARPCVRSQVSVTQYNVSVAAGTVGELYWIAPTAGVDCSIHGYVRVAFTGNYGMQQSREPPILLNVTERHVQHYSDFAGVVPPRTVPTVSVSPRGPIASFYIFGTDEQYGLGNGKFARCIFSDDMSLWLPGGSLPLTVVPMRGQDLLSCGPVTVYPVVAGDTGADPPYPLNRMFGNPY